MAPAFNDDLLAGLDACREQLTATARTMRDLGWAVDVAAAMLVQLAVGAALDQSSAQKNHGVSPEPVGDFRADAA